MLPTEKKTRNLKARLKTSFATGFLVLIPITVTIFFIKAVIQFCYRFFVPAIKLFGGLQTPLPELLVPLVGTVVGLLFILAVGMLTQNVVGRNLINAWERVLQKVPFISTVYNLIKEIMDAVMAYRHQEFKSVVMVEWPRAGAYVFGFITSENRNRLPICPGEKLYNVFIPTTPNPTSGYLVIMPEKDVVPLEMKVEEAVKLLISGGMVVDKSASRPE